MVVSDEVMSLEYSTDLEFSVSLTNQRSLTMAASTRQSFSKSVLVDMLCLNKGYKEKRACKLRLFLD